MLVACPGAEKLGIRPGMTLGEALALAGPHTLRWHAWDPQTDRQYLEALGFFCQQFSPHVAVDPQPVHAALLIDIAGSASYFGGEEATCRAVARALQELGLRFRLAVADTPTAAWAVAFYGGEDSHPGSDTPEAHFQIISPGRTAEALYPLPVAALRLDPALLEVLSQLGIYTVDQFARIPPEELTCRFGREVWRRWQEAIGLLPEVLSFLPPPGQLWASFIPEFPLNDTPALLAAIEGLISPLLAQLQDRRQGVIALRLLFGEEALSGQKAPPVSTEVLFHRPTLAKNHILGVIGVRLETLRWRGAICWVELEILQTGPLEEGEYFLVFREQDPGEDRPRQLGEILDCLRARLGTQAVCSPTLTGEVQPERSWLPGPPCPKPHSLSPSALTKNGRRPATGRLPLTVSPPGIYQTPPRQSGKSSGSPASDEQIAFSARDTLPKHPKLSLQPSLPRPTTLLSNPIPLPAIVLSPWGAPAQFILRGKRYRVVRSWGPERIETGWWRGESVRRDYFRTETSTGHRFWLFRDLDTGRWFLHGIFD